MIKKIKLIVFIIIAIILGFFSCTGPGGGSSGGGSSGGGSNGGSSSSSSSSSFSVNPEELRSNWTIVIHFAIDNNIDYIMEQDYGIVSNYLSTLENLKKKDTNNKLKIVVLMDACNKSSYTSKYKDGYYYLTGQDFTKDLVVEKSEINSGNVQDSKDFINWAITNYPSEGYSYIIFNHGGGFDDATTSGKYSQAKLKAAFKVIQKGIAFDDSSNDCLTHYELGEVTGYFKNLIGKKIELFYTFACLMGGIELAYEVRNNADYILFSEDLFPADYWSFEGYNVVLSKDKTAAVEIGKSVCDSAYDYFMNNNRYFGLSLFDLRKIDDIYQKVNDFAAEAVNDMNLNDNAFEYFRMSCKSYNVLYDTELTFNCYYYLDLGSFMYWIQETNNISQSVRDKAKDVFNSINSGLVYKKTYFSNDRMTGVTIFHNIWYSEYKYPVTTYRSILSFGANKWSDYQEKFLSYEILVAKDIYEDDNFSSDAKNYIKPGESQIHTSYPIPKNLVLGNYIDRDWYYLDLSNAAPGSVYKIEVNDNLIKTAPNKMKNSISVYYNGNDLYGMSKSDGNTVIYIVCDNPGIYLMDVVIWQIMDYKIDVQLVNGLIPDQYENDDSFANAKEIKINEVQTHNFHAYKDKDYIYFYGQKDKCYLITCENNVLPIIDVFSEDDMSNPVEYLPGVNSLSETTNNIAFNCKKSCRYYIKTSTTGDKDYVVGNAMYSYKVKVEQIDGFMYGPRHLSYFQWYNDPSDALIKLYPGCYGAVYGLYSVQDEGYMILNCYDVKPGSKLVIESFPLYANQNNFYNSIGAAIDMTLYDIPGIPMLYGTQNGDKTKIEWICNEPGKYYLKVKGRSSSPIGNYIINFYIKE